MRTLAVVFASLLIAGCSEQPPVAVKTGPTYAEAVATYQAEVALLDSLLAKRKAIEDEYSASVSRDRSSFAYTDRHAAAFDDAARQVVSLSLGSVESLASDKTESDDLRESFKKLLVC